MDFAPQPTFVASRRAVIVLVVVTLLVFVLDLFTPLGINDGYFYAISVIVTLWMRGRLATYITGIVAIALIIIAYYAGLSKGDQGEYSVLNRLFAAIGIFITAFAVLKNKDKERLMELQNVKLLQNVEKLNRSNAELEEYAHMASHDLQEPLRKITSYISLLQKRLGTNIDKETEYFFTVIVNAAQKMRALISSFLTFSQIGKNREFTSVDTNKLLVEVVDSLETYIRESKATIDASDLPVINAVESEMKQVFRNLLLNAIKFSKKDTPPEIRIRCETKADEWLFSVADNGIGISEKYFDKLFVIFERLHVDDDYPGLGIGLASCKKIIELNNGKIWLTSKSGIGSTFYFTISRQQV